MSVKLVKSLLFKSLKIQSQIEAEQSSRWPDWIRLLRLKKMRLMIKDRLARLFRREWPRTLGLRLQTAPVSSDPASRRTRH